jgi:hypothetical protein
MCSIEKRNFKYLSGENILRAMKGWMISLGLVKGEPRSDALRFLCMMAAYLDDDSASA